jgi:hypothetical protein
MRHVFIEIGSGALVRADGVGMMQGVKSQAGKVYFVCRGGPGGASGPSVDLASYAVSMMFLAGNYPRAGFEEQWRAEGIAEEVLACPSTQGLAHDALGTALGMCSVRSHSTAQVHDQRLGCHAGRCPASWRSAEGEAARQVPLEALAGLGVAPPDASLVAQVVASAAFTARRTAGSPDGGDAPMTDEKRLALGPAGDAAALASALADAEDAQRNGFRARAHPRV